MAGCKWDVLLMQSERLLPGVGTSDATALAIGTLAPVMGVVRYKVGSFHKVYQRIHDRTKIKMKGYVAVQRKLLCLIYALWKTDSAFNPDHNTKTTSGTHDPKPLFGRPARAGNKSSH
jgi:hypothetical protein